jgi:hypothetical protein
VKTEAACSSQTSVDFQRTRWSYIPEDSTLHNHRCENLKSYIVSHSLHKKVLKDIQDCHGSQANQAAILGAVHFIIFKKLISSDLLFMF